MADTLGSNTISKTGDVQLGVARLLICRKKSAHCKHKEMIDVLHVMLVLMRACHGRQRNWIEVGVLITVNELLVLLLVETVSVT